MVFQVSLSQQVYKSGFILSSLSVDFYIQILPTCGVDPSHLSASHSLGNLFGASAVRICSPV